MDNDLTRAHLQNIRALEFRILVWAIAFVIAGVILEEIELILEIFHIKTERLEVSRLGVIVVPRLRVKRWIRIISHIGWLVLVVGLVAEIRLEPDISEIDRNIGSLSEAQVETARGEAARAGERAAEANRKAADANETAEAERLARVRIEARVAWRHLTDRQKADMAASLGDFSNQQGAALSYLTGDTEAAMFADDIAESLKLAHIVVQPPADVMALHATGRFGDPITRINTGVNVNSTKDEHSRSLADAVVRELNARGFDATRGQDNPPKNEWRPIVGIRVNPRPEGPQGEYKLQAERGANAKKKKAQGNQTTH